MSNEKKRKGSTDSWPNHHSPGKCTDPGSDTSIASRWNGCFFLEKACWLTSTNSYVACVWQKLNPITYSHSSSSYNICYSIFYLTKEWKNKISFFSACCPACEQKVFQNQSKWLWQDLNLRQWRLQPKCSALDHSATKSDNQVRSGNWTRDHFHPKEVSYP